MLICCIFFARSLVTTFVSIRGDGNANIFSDLWKVFSTKGRRGFLEFFQSVFGGRRGFHAFLS